MINQSLTSGIFPQDLKTAKVIPVFKKDDNSKFDNYRPISILNSFSKIYEKVVYQQLYHYLTRNKILINSQYGFCANLSTEDAVLEFVDTLINEIETNNFLIAIFLNLSKAFNTIDHQLPLYKLKYYGILDNELNWFNSYLSSREQYVQVYPNKSSKYIIKSGVPQGSILGPLLFLL